MFSVRPALQWLAFWPKNGTVPDRSVNAYHDRNCRSPSGPFRHMCHLEAHFEFECVFYAVAPSGLGEGLTTLWPCLVARIVCFGMLKSFLSSVSGACSWSGWLGFSWLARFVRCDVGDLASGASARLSGFVELSLAVDP